MKSLIKILNILLFSIVVAEGVCRVLISFKEKRIEWVPPILPDFESKDGPGVYMAHPYTAYRMKPTNVRQVQGEDQNFINQDGFRNDREFPSEHPGVIRVLCLGSSTTYGVRNRYNESYPFSLEQYLNTQDPKHSYEVINAGLVSSTTAEHSARLPRILMDKNPDVIVIYEGFNDLVPRIFNNFTLDYSHFRKTPSSLNLPFFTSLLRSSFFMRFFLKNINGEESLHDYIINKENLPATEDEKILNFRKNTTEAFEKNIDYLVRLSMAYNVKIFLPSFAFMPGKNDFWVKFFPDALWEEGIRQNNQILKNLSEKYSLKQPDINLLLKDHPDVFLGKIHFNAEGNRMIARAIGEEILGFSHN